MDPAPFRTVPTVANAGANSGWNADAIVRPGTAYSLILSKVFDIFLPICLLPQKNELLFLFPKILGLFSLFASMLLYIFNITEI